MAIRQADRLESNNPKAFGIAKATQISGHKTVTSLSKLYEIPDCILSDSKTNQNEDAIGQDWYVISERCKFTLIDWSKRREKDGWKKYSGIESTIQAGDRIQIEKNLERDIITISADSEIDDNIDSSSNFSWSIDKIKDVISGRGVKLVTQEIEEENSKIKLEVNVDNESIGFDESDRLNIISVDGGTYN